MSSPENKLSHVANSDLLPALPIKYDSTQKVYGLMQNSSINDAQNAMLLLESGLVLRYSNKRRKFEDGQVDLLEAPFKWREEARIKLEGVHQIKEALEDFQAEDTKETNAEYSSTIINFVTVPATSITVESKMNTPKGYNLQTTLNKITTENIIYKGVPLTQEEE